ncbi:MAG: hypoxanthine phosphoribosyltransferase [Chitinophagales bacterium]|nr:hypoxanthine phosphoribosyltransferase [Chitinophagales bacterium]
MNKQTENIVSLHDKQFSIFIEEEKILAAVKSVAEEINQAYEGKKPLLIPVLNGSFMFTADLAKFLNIDCEFSFIKASSYSGTNSSGSLQEKIGLSENISGRHVIIVEDIIDTGNTLARLLPEMELQLPASIKICSLLFKPKALKADLKVDFVGLEIPNDFIVGYGLDYDGLGRNLRNIYKIV